MKHGPSLSPEIINMLHSILIKYTTPSTKIWLFGSRAKGTQKKYSDIDIAIDSENLLPITQLAALITDLEESDIPYKVDIVDLNATDASFRKRIDSEKIELFRF